MSARDGRQDLRQKFRNIPVAEAEAIAARLTGATAYTKFAVFAAFITSSAWPVTLTFRQTFRTFPSPPIRNVLRSIPIYRFPYIDFSTQVE